ncbi:unnamed protein product [Schistocephalus solidus]|uniref:Uncharacterized protein n=1 Tax=Schistocephalus solidus TaxID=70667 RepID=A0A183T4K8_SCHSO|nr:unnamed protein product [Schistocephalus solidus]
MGSTQVTNALDRHRQGPGTPIIAKLPTHLRRGNQLVISYPTTSIPASANIPSTNPASNPMTTTTPNTGGHSGDAPPPSITSTILHPAVSPSITTGTTSHIPCTAATTSDYLPPATLTTTAPTTNDVDSILACPHFDRTFTLPIGLVGHL